jgi:CheY-like chemotaxis protein
VQIPAEGPVCGGANRLPESSEDAGDCCSGWICPVTETIPERSRSRGLLLIVEDDLLLRDGMADLLRAVGYVVETCSNGPRALERLREGRRPDLILIELITPTMNSWVFRQEQEQDPEIRDIPLIVLSESGRSTVFPTMPFLEKPFSAEIFLALVDCLMRHRPRWPRKLGVGR